MKYVFRKKQPDKCTYLCGYYLPDDHVLVVEMTMENEQRLRNLRELCECKEVDDQTVRQGTYDAEGNLVRPLPGDEDGLRDAEEPGAGPAESVERERKGSRVHRAR